MKITLAWMRVVGVALVTSALGLCARGQDVQPPKEPAEPAPTFDGVTGDWWGWRRELAERGIAVDVSYVVDGTANLRGGLDTADRTWRRMLDATLRLDTKPLLGLEGGTIFVDFQHAEGPNPSDDLIGDVQGIDGLDGVPGAPHQNRTQLAQLWYQQVALDGKLRVKAGKVDANSEFDHSEVAQEFLHQSTGSSATLFTLPTYPDPATGVNVFVKPVEEVQIGFGLYDGSYANGVRTGLTGPRTFFRSAEDLFLISEVDLSWKTGRMGVGGWYSTNSFVKLDGGRATGTGGPYALVEQTLWRANPKDEKDERGVRCFVMYGYADPAVLIYDHNIGGGIAWTGPLPGRVEDVLGAGVQAVHFGRAREEFEASYEMFYRVQVSPWLAVKPDVQYIAHPGGQGTRDALALTVRLEMHF